ncbi:hypothetical protein LRD18_02105 [Halorhodospira halochloris]|uniref:hypothetical protein n=1 Tax=Halorhodospira halochloris TaxID=1052 RepID=UPI001EE91CA4|nr:hypothetical protein [Halorhodospira halochloris]MCG5529667.1 hypothetical protein [Halorhodospira halochloris]
MNPSLEASWCHPWRQDLHTGADGGDGEVLEATLGVKDAVNPSLESSWRHPWCQDLHT